MSEPELSQLHRRARKLGVQTEFADTRGERQGARTETLRAVVKLLSDRASDREPPFPRVIVCWDGKAKSVPLRTGEGRLKNRSFPLTAALALDPGNQVVGSADAAGKKTLRVAVRTGSGAVALHVPPLP